MECVFGGVVVARPSRERHLQEGTIGVHASDGSNYKGDEPPYSPLTAKRNCFPKKQGLTQTRSIWRPREPANTNKDLSWRGPVV